MHLTIILALLSLISFALLVIAVSIFGIMKAFKTGIDSFSSPNLLEDISLDEEDIPEIQEKNLGPQKTQITKLSKTNKLKNPKKSKKDSTIDKKPKNLNTNTKSNNKDKK